MSSKRIASALVGAASLLGTVAVAGPAAANGEVEDDRQARIYEVTVEVRNRAPENGTALTPFWVGAHDGSFDLYDRNEPLGAPLQSGAFERLVEDGNIGPLADQFNAETDGEDAIVFGPDGPLLPGQTGTATFLVAAERGEPLYFSYASMVLPSNDAFVANGDPEANLLVDRRGRTRDFRVQILGDDVLDGGTEVNTEGPSDTAFLNQSGPDAGTVENGVVMQHPGFNPAQTDPFANVLGTPRFANADFTADRYRVADVRVSAERVRSNVTAELSGDAEVPGVETEASGRAFLRIEEDGDIAFNLRASEITDVLFAHIHIGAPGENGPVAVTLFNGDPTDDGRLRIRGAVADGDLVGPLAGMTTADLWAEILAGNAYINIHTEQVPSGELRADLG